MANISFGERLRRGRIKNAWTQAELAQKLGVTQVTISTWQTGKIQLALQQKIKVREILGLNSPDGGNAREDQTEVQTDDQTGPSAFGSWLNRTRIERGLSIAELALKAEVSAPAIYNVESGRIENPRKETLRRLEQALGKELPAE